MVRDVGRSGCMIPQDDQPDELASDGREASRILPGGNARSVHGSRWNDNSGIAHEEARPGLKACETIRSLRRNSGSSAVSLCSDGTRRGGGDVRFE